jgi:hypothetical protein
MGIIRRPKERELPHFEAWKPLPGNGSEDVVVDTVVYVF